MHSVTKRYIDFPAAHRQPRHKGHCSMIHGHNFGFDIVFVSDQLDDNGFVIDVGTLGSVKKYLTDTFDHTLLLNSDDPELENLLKMNGKLADIRVVGNCGMERLAEMVYWEVEQVLLREFKTEVSRYGLRVRQVTVWEDSKNSATFPANVIYSATPLAPSPQIPIAFTA